MTSIRFASRVDALILAMPAIVVLALLVQGYMLRATAPAASLIMFVVAVLLPPVFALLAVPCQYELQTDQLLIQAGRIKWRIDYRDITAVEPSSNPHSAPALSLRRVKISHAGRTILVSPNDRDRFIRLLNERVAMARG